MKKIILVATVLLSMYACERDYPHPYPYPPGTVPSTGPRGQTSGTSGSGSGTGSNGNSNSGSGQSGNVSSTQNTTLGFDTVITVTLYVNAAVTLDSLAKPFGFVNPTVLNAFFPDEEESGYVSMKVIQLNAEATSSDIESLLDSKNLKSGSARDLATYANYVRKNPPPYWVLSLSPYSYHGSILVNGFGMYRGQSYLSWDEFSYYNTWSPVATSISLPYRILAVPK